MYHKTIRVHLVLLFFVISTTAFSGDPSSCTSIANGNFTAAGTWSCVGGSVPGKSTDVTINHDVTLNTSFTGGSKLSGDWDITDGSSLIGAGESLEWGSGTSTISGTLSVDNLSFNNGAEVTFASTSSIIVAGDFTNDNNSDEVVVNTTSFTVAGNLSNGEGAVISGTGSIDVDGTITNIGAGKLFGCSGDGCCTNEGDDDCVLALPIELLSFEVYHDGTSTVYRWTTASELNNEYFIIEKSVDGVVYSPVIEVLGAGNSYEKIDYVYNELHSVSDGDMYYRIVDVDYDGVRTASDVFTLSSNDGSNEIDVHVRNGTKLIVSGVYAESAELFLYDVLGGLKRHHKLVGPAGVVTLPKGISSGLSLVIIRDLNGSVLYSTKLVK